MNKKTMLAILSLFLVGCATQTTPSADTPTLQIEMPEPVLKELFFEELNRDIFTSNLIPSQQYLLNELRDATIYQISLNISDDLVHISGHQNVTYTNQENIPLNEVYFHLMPNYLGDSMLISEVTVDEKTVSFELEMNDSAMYVPLETPLKVGETISIGLDFLTIVPTQLESNYGILAYTEDVLAFAHGYPMVTVYDNEGWNIDIPSEQGDVTYLDTSFYHVQVNAPEDLVLVASGNEIKRKAEGDRQTVTFAAGPARDFYLVASPSYVLRSQKFGEYTINSYALAEFEEGSDFAIDVAVAAIEFFSDTYAPYPYTEFDIVSTPTYALGIEYPGMTAINVDLYDLDSERYSVPTSIYLESTVAHEVGHQWFYNSVGNDQLDEPWLDESLVQYITWQYYENRYGTNSGAGFANALDSRWERIERADIPLGLPVGAYSGAEYSAIIYGRGAFFFETLENEIGAENFALFMQEYTQNQQWGIATTESLRASAEKACNCDLEPLFSEWIY